MKRIALAGLLLCCLPSLGQAQFFNPPLVFSGSGAGCPAGTITQVLTVADVSPLVVPTCAGTAGTVTVEVIGAAGAPGYGQGGVVYGGGGCAGAYSKGTLSVTAGASLPFTVGAAGVTAGSPNNAGGNGGDSWFNGASFGAASVAAKGGGGGKVGLPSTTCTQALASAGIGTTKNNGGIGGFGTGPGSGAGAGGPNGAGANGALPTTGTGMAGGGAADGGSAGGAGSGTTAGGSGGNNVLAYGGGEGGSAAAFQVYGTDGVDRGGGGGGMGSTSAAQPGNGGRGGDGILPDIVAGPGGGGGAGGGATTNVITTGAHGGNGGNCGGSAGANGMSPAGQGVPGTSAAGCIIISWTNGTTAITANATAPCDLVTCAEAYSVTRRMISSYSGPLFQLSNGSSTLDIGQTANGVVDMTTWSAFCTAVQSNCFIRKIYAQINTTSNDLPAFTLAGAFSQSPVCNGGTADKCAAKFAIEPQTGLPILLGGWNSTSALAHEYSIAADAAATGINGGTNPLSVMVNGRGVTAVTCCGFFGISHKYNAGDTPGTDFLLELPYSNTGAFSQCGTATTYCVGIDEEITVDTGDYGSAVKNIVAFITSGSTGTVATAAANGTQLFSLTPATSPLNPGLSIHLGGGGDLSAAPMLFREGIITNSALSAGQQAPIVANETAFYAPLSFP